MRRLPTSLLALLLTGVLVALSGCSTTLGDLPLPGTGVAGDTVTVHAEFADALNLSQGAIVKVNGVDSGKVEAVGTRDFHAEVTLVVRTDAQLRLGATARLRYTTPLGELFVDITNPRNGPLMGADATLPLTQTSTAPTVEDALSEASLLVNGGGLAQLQTITSELNTALDGRQQTVRSLLERSRDVLRQADLTTGDIDRALHALDDVSTTLDRRHRVIDRALHEIRPAAAVLRRDTPGLTRLLKQVDAFAGTADDTVVRTRRTLLGLARQAAPVLADFADHGSTYPLGLAGLTRIGHAIDGATPGDYLDLSLSFHLDQLSLPALTQLLGQLGLSTGAAGPLQTDGALLGLSGLTRRGGR